MRIAPAFLIGSSLASTAAAQSIAGAEYRLAPQWTQYRIDAPVDVTVSELAIPLFVSMPMGDRASFDIGTAYARAQVTSGAERSDIAGLTDVQLRAQYTLGSDRLVLTGGINLPTGNESVSADQLAAASLIGSDFFAFPVSNMGTGLAITGGAAIAYPLGAWNLGAGASVRRSRAYEPFAVPGESFRYQPGNEVRLRVGVDRPVAEGRVAFGATYATFGRDDAGGYAYNTGDRLIALGELTGRFGEQDYTVAAYNVFRAPGSYASGDRAGRENIANLFLSLGLHTLGTVLEPSLELRDWMQNVYDEGDATGPARSQNSRLATLGLRARIDAGRFELFPSGAYTPLGHLATTNDAGLPVQARLTGFHVGIVVRTSP
ncbi:MAG: hypothetical protein JF589_16715 [Gemmatimonadetes bacterium]|nr:hypothetical protein [Gemmatimonadota bacterium]